jgi:hypothetical protein
MRQLLVERCRYALGWGRGCVANRLKCQILVRCPCRIEMDTWNEDSLFGGGWRSRAFSTIWGFGLRPETDIFLIYIEDLHMLRCSPGFGTVTAVYCRA